MAGTDDCTPLTPIALTALTCTAYGTPVTRPLITCWYWRTPTTAGMRIDAYPWGRVAGVATVTEERMGEAEREAMPEESISRRWANTDG